MSHKAPPTDRADLEHAILAAPRRAILSLGAAPGLDPVYDLAQGRPRPVPLAGRLEDGLLITWQPGPRPLQRRQPRVQPRKMPLDGGHDAALFWGRGQRNAGALQDLAANGRKSRARCPGGPVWLDVAQVIQAIVVRHAAPGPQRRQPAPDARLFPAQIGRADRGADRNQDVARLGHPDRLHTPAGGRGIQLAKLGLALVKRQAHALRVIGARGRRLPRHDFASLSQGLPRPPRRQARRFAHRRCTLGRRSSWSIKAFNSASVRGRPWPA